ncbi:hypothetical protein E1176_00825, partial [Fulvivirga sp. RKSG066]|nr:hypothetical protein [Fulvivirga aurantia]
MDFERIEQLLAKYWECETSLVEEKELRKFFSEEEVPDHLMPYKSLFVYYEQERQDGQLDEVFDKSVLNKISSLQESGAPKKGKVVRLFYDISRVAAVVLVVVTAGYFVKQEYMDKKEEVQPYLTDTFEDPQAAFEETKKAFKMISANFNKGRQEARKVGVFNDAQEKA